MVVAIPGLGVIAAALLGMVLIYAAAQMAPWLEHLFGGLGHWLGSAIGKAVARVSKAATAAWQGTVDGVLGKLGDTIGTAVTGAEYVWQRIETLAATSINMTGDILQQTIPSVLKSSLATAEGLVITAKAALTRDIKSVRQKSYNGWKGNKWRIGKLAGAVAVDVASLLAGRNRQKKTVEAYAKAQANAARNAAEKYSDAKLGAEEKVINAAHKHLADEITSARVYAKTQAATDAKSAQANAEHYAKAYANQHVGFESAKIAAAAAPGWRDIAGNTGNLTATTKTGMPHLSDLFAAIPTAAPTTAAAAMAGNVAMLRSLMAVTRSCTIPNCQNLSKLGRDVKAANGVMSDGTVMALLLGLIADPQAGATAVRDVVDPIIDLVKPTVEHLVGA